MPDPTPPNNDWQQVPHTPGDPAASAPPPVQPPTNYAQQGYPPPSAYPPAAPGITENTAAAVSYLTFVPAVIFLIVEPYSKQPFVRFHAMQCILMSVAWMILSFILRIFFHLLGIFALLGLVVWPLIFLCVFIIWIYTLYQASQGKWFKLPVIGDLAQQLSQRQ